MTSMTRQSMDPTPTEKQIKIRVNHSISKNVQQICTDLHKRKSHRKYFQANGSGWLPRAEFARDEQLDLQRDP